MYTNFSIKVKTSSLYGVPVVSFQTLRNEKDVEMTVRFAQQAYAERSALSLVTEAKVLIVDYRPSSVLLETVAKLEGKFFEVYFCSNALGERPPESRVFQQVRTLLGSRARIGSRNEFPSCAAMLSPGEFANAICIITPPGAHGLYSAMKALLEVTYSDEDGGFWSFEEDAAFFASYGRSDPPGPLSKLFHEYLELPCAWTFGQAQLYEEFVHIVRGDTQLRAEWQMRVSYWKSALIEAQRLMSAAEQVAGRAGEGGVLLVDATQAQSRLAEAILPDQLSLLPPEEPWQETKVVAVRTSHGCVARRHGGTQYTLTVVEDSNGPNLEYFLPEGFVSSTEAGVVSAAGLSLYLSEDVWRHVVLPALQMWFGGQPQWCAAGEHRVFAEPGSVFVVEGNRPIPLWSATCTSEAHNSFLAEPLGEGPPKDSLDTGQAQEDEVRELTGADRQLLETRRLIAESLCQKK